MFQDEPKMTASQRCTTQDCRVEPLPNVPASVISLFAAHDLTKLFKLTIKLPLRNGRSTIALQRSAVKAICVMRNGENEHAAAAAALMSPVVVMGQSSPDP